MSRRTTLLMIVFTAISCSIARAEGKPLKVYVLAGQSNMEGQARIETFDYIGHDPATAPLLKAMRGPDGKETSHLWRTGWDTRCCPMAHLRFTASRWPTHELSLMTSVL